MIPATAPGLLVSVRSVAEASAALDGGAAIIDVKEPAKGSLGKSDRVTIHSVLECVAGRRPVSAALGELSDLDAEIPNPAYVLGEGGRRLDYVKWGLAGCRQRSGWSEFFVRQWRQRGLPQAVIVGYVDWQVAEAPALTEVLKLVLQRSGQVLLLDTYSKDIDPRLGSRRPTLLDWLGVEELADVCRRCRTAGVRIALAGSLGPAEIATLLPTGPDWFAVRGAVCAGSSRHGVVDTARVQALARLLNGGVFQSAAILSDAAQ